MNNKASRFTIGLVCAASILLFGSSGQCQTSGKFSLHRTARTATTRTARIRPRGRSFVDRDDESAFEAQSEVMLAAKAGSGRSNRIPNLLAEVCPMPAKPVVVESLGFDQDEADDFSPQRLDEAASLQLIPTATSASPTLRLTEKPKTESLFSLDYLKLIGADTKQVFTAPFQWDGQDWLVFGGVSAGIGLTYLFDEDIRKAVQRNRNHTTEKIFDGVQPLGDKYSFGVLAAFYVGGSVLKDPKAKAVALDGLSASIIASGLITTPLKFVAGRSRPDHNQGSDHFQMFTHNMSFPSGHTTQAFAVASVIAAHYDSLWIKAASYGLASMVGYARLNNDAHWASDVVAGAAIGTFVGHVVVHFNEQHRHLTLTPMIGARMQGVQITWSF